MTRNILIKKMEVEIPESDLDKDTLDIDFNGDYMVQIIKQENGSWRCSNAMDGYGRNCAIEFINEPVSII